MEMFTPIKEEYKFIIKLFDKYSVLYEKLFSAVKLRKQNKVIWSNSYLELYPYQYELQQLSGVKVYKNEPESKEGVIETWLDKEGPYFSFHAENMDWGVRFIIKDGSYRICLGFFRNDDDDISLNQIYCTRFNERIIDSVLYYGKDSDYDEETFFIDRYTYIGERVNLISRSGFYEEQSNILPLRTFRFDYTKDFISIYSKQDTVNENGLEQLVYKKAYSGSSY